MMESIREVKIMVPHDFRSSFMVRTLWDGPLRVVDRLRRARMRWKAEVPYFSMNVTKCDEI